jgi:hypothetical protein
MTSTPCKSCKHGYDRRSQETVTFCAEHQSEHDATRARWNADYRLEHPLAQSNTEARHGD